jgi:tetratricopeptide (TPR) repeat protein
VTAEPLTEFGRAAVPDDEASAYRTEIDAAALRLRADRSDLDRLLAYVHAKGALRQRVAAVLAQGHSRLTRLRAGRDEDTRLASGQEAVAVPVERAYAALQPGAVFSLEAAEDAFADAVKCAGNAVLHAPRLAARLCAAQALVAAIRQEQRRAADLYSQAAATPGLPMPVQWVYEKERADVLAELGREWGDNAAIAEAVELYEETVLPLVPRAERPDEWAATQHDLGNALGVLGSRRRGTRLLERAVATFEHALSARSRERAPLEWAATQHDLGNALGILAQRQGDTELLEKAVEAFESALRVRTRERKPQAWAATQNHLGTALLTLGQLKRDTAILERSVAAFREVLEVWTREQAPVDWGATQNSIGTALRVRGEQGGDPRELEEAVSAYRSALTVRTRERMPQDWAMTQNNLGAALQRLGERQNDTRLLGEAVAAYENALEEWGREDMPMTWAMTTANLGVARRGLAERAQDVGASRRAVADLEEAVAVFQDASHPQYYELAKEELVKAQGVAASLGG